MHSVQVKPAGYRTSKFHTVATLLTYIISYYT